MEFGSGMLRLGWRRSGSSGRPGLFGCATEIAVGFDGHIFGDVLDSLAGHRGSDLALMLAAVVGAMRGLFAAGPPGVDRGGARGSLGCGCFRERGSVSDGVQGGDGCGVGVGEGVLTGLNSAESAYE